MAGLAALAVSLRLLARYERKQKLWWDDWLIMFSMVETRLVSLQTILVALLTIDSRDGIWSSWVSSSA